MRQTRAEQASEASGRQNQPGSIAFGRWTWRAGGGAVGLSSSADGWSGRASFLALPDTPEPYKVDPVDWPVASTTRQS
jgi:hypothetical protein